MTILTNILATFLVFLNHFVLAKYSIPP